MEDLVVGSQLMVRKLIEDEEFYHKAEIMSIRETTNGLEYYVHFLEFNKRLDEWVDLSRMDLLTIETKDQRTPEEQQPKTPASSKKRKATSTQKKKKKQQLLELDDASSSTVTDVNEYEKLRRGGSMTQRPEEIARLKNIDMIEMGPHRVKTWYFSPYPEDLIRMDGPDGDAGVVFLCEFCLGWFGTRMHLRRHRAKCPLFHPPGQEVYRHGNYSFFELDGHRQKTWCRNLCLLSKLFLDHKTLFYDVDPFLFYVLTENDTRGCHILGYFSKEKESLENYNLACILTLPQHQRKGYGKLLIEFSYELTRREGKVGSPEKPLSDLGLLSYRSYWAEAIMRCLLDDFKFTGGRSLSITLEQLSKATGITCEDLVFTLQAFDGLRYRKGQYVIVLPPPMLDDYERAQRKGTKFEPKSLHWTPPVFTPAQLRFI